jgi:hypothetical protein
LFTYFGKEVGRFDGEEFDAQSPYARKAAFTRLVAIIRFGTIAAAQQKSGHKKTCHNKPPTDQGGALDKAECGS